MRPGSHNCGPMRQTKRKKDTKRTQFSALPLSKTRFPSKKRTQTKPPHPTPAAPGDPIGNRQSAIRSSESAFLIPPAREPAASRLRPPASSLRPPVSTQCHCVALEEKKYLRNEAI